MLCATWTEMVILIDSLDYCMIKCKSLYSMCQQTKYLEEGGMIWSYDFCIHEV